MPSDENAERDIEAVKHLNEAYRKMTDMLGRVIVGQVEVIEQVLVAMFCQGHALLVGVPGLAKTLLIRTISEVLHLSFKRIQFTPDLMPSDITGTDVLEEDRTTGRRAFRFVHGPLFANMILADEINRTPPKTQAALLEAMQEHRVTVGEETYRLPEPFFVLATQNPIEQEGTYPLPEAQLDRFMFMILVDYPDPEEEIQIMKQVTSSQLGRRTQGEHLHDPGGQGPRHPARALPRHHRGRPSHGPAGAQAPHYHHLQRRGRRHNQRRDRPSAVGGDPAGGG